MKKNILLMMALTVALSAFASKPPLDHSVYDNWKSVSGLSVQNDGDWARWTVAPQEGDLVLHLYNVKTGKTYDIERASQAKISEDATKLIFKIAPKFQETRQAKIDKKKPNEMPKDTLGILDLATGKIEKYPMLKGFKAGETLGDYVAFQEAEKPAPKPDPKDKKPAKEGEKPEKPEKKPAPKSTKDNLYILNIKTLAVDTIQCVESYIVSKEGDKVAFITKPDAKDSVNVRGVFVYDPAAKACKEVLKGEKKATFKGLGFNDEATCLAFYGTLDTAKDASKILDLWLYDGNSAKKIVAGNSSALPKGWKLGADRPADFHDGYLTFGTCPIPREKDTTLVDFEQPKLDIWVWNDDYIQTVQKNNLRRDLAKTYLAKVNFDGTGFVQLADEQIPNVGIDEKNKQDYIIATTDKPYRVQRSWSYAAHSDIYKISLKDGSRELICKDAPFSNFSISPDGAYAVGFHSKENNWYLYTLATGEFKELTSRLGVTFWNEEDDHPADPGAWGRAAWADDSKFFWIPDQYDLWQFDPTGAVAPFRVTEGKGRETRTTYNYTSPYFDPEARGPFGGGTIKTDKPVYFSTFNHVTKEHGYAVKDFGKKKAKLQKVVEGPYNFGNLAVSKGKKGNALIYTRGNFEDGNNVWMTRDNFKTQQQMSDINPQQRDYNWGTVELVSWTSEDGKPLEGLLFKPENFDPAKKYPVMIYFYERNSETLYNSRVPAPSASTVNIPYFVSNEYLVFVPDLVYTDGHPGQSCLKCLMPGVDMLCEYPWVDGDNMAIQGQSWGGYQVAYLITQTNRFKAAGAGAPVSNMTSAYGGIRWESGIARTGQYEEGQSRIGKNLWDGFDLYVENSPLFHVPNVTTPVLIMHNDADGAVPWWQGIEFYNGLRRMGKQAWMLQYNDEAHNLRERRNRKDLSIRLSQFFDHFLKGAPMPVWMSKGVPATLKGIEYGYGYDEENL
ncbi:MAG: prolyl oligopeptidase family serine peptidase [Bacteroidales bacterium]|nr:prolyl oligopeptidase family serine peptidase [Bacteroidales bacterium]